MIEAHFLQQRLETRLVPHVVVNLVNLQIPTGAILLLIRFFQPIQNFPLLAKSRIDQISLECANSRVPLELLALLEGKDVLVGAIDVANETVERPEQVAATIRATMKFVPAEKLYPCTNCGMVPLPREIALGKLRALAYGAALVRREIGV